MIKGGGREGEREKNMSDHGSNSWIILSNRITANNLDAKPAIQASNKTVNINNELNPAAFVNVEDFICLAVGFLSGYMTFLAPPGVLVLFCIFKNFFIYLNV